MNKRDILQPPFDEAFKVSYLRRLYLDALNLVSNSGFETDGVGDPDFWANWSESAGDGVLENETTIVHKGNNAVKMTGGASNNTTIYADNISVTAGKKYRLRFRTQGDGTNGGQYRIQNLTLGGDIIVTTPTGVTAEAYAIVVKGFTPVAGTTAIRLRFYSPPANGGVCYFDTCDLYLLN